MKETTLEEQQQATMYASPDGKKVKFPFFDSANNPNNSSRNYVLEGGSARDSKQGFFTPPPGNVSSFTATGLSTPIDSNWESEISPITRNSDSDCRTLDVGELRMNTPQHNLGENVEDIDSMLFQLKDIIHQSQKKQKERRRRSSIGSISRRCDSDDDDFLLEALTSQKMTGDDTRPMSPSFGQTLGATSPQREAPPTGSPSDSGNTLNEDISEATKRINESSNNFIRRIRDVANRRKLSMTRSRDYLKAMENERLKRDEDVDGKKVLDTTNDLQKTPKSRKESTSTHDQNGCSTQKLFKARPAPETTGFKGVGGLDGVPKVDKRPLTTPLSPLLGARRPEKVKVNALREPKNIKPLSSTKKKCSKTVSIVEPPKLPKYETQSQPTFKARPMPSFISRKGQGGLSGVPKVQKRPLTVPKSPMLGVRRTSILNKKAANTLRERKSAEDNQTSLVSQSSDLHGLMVLESSHSDFNVSRVENNENRRPMNRKDTIFKLQSSARAKQRADYNFRRDENLKRRRALDLKSRQTEVRKMEKELIALRMSL